MFGKISILHKYLLFCFVRRLKHLNTKFSFADFSVLVASDVFLAVLYASLCLNGPGVIIVVCSPGYRSSGIEVCTAGVLSSSIANL